MKTSITALSLLVSMVLTNLAIGQHMIFYSNDTDGYSFKYPETWKRADDMDGKLSMVALAPEESEAEDGVRERLNVAVFDLADRSKAAFYEQLKVSHQEANRSWKLAEDGEVMGRNSKALYFSCYYSDAETGITQSEFVYVFTNNKKAYVLTCTTSFDHTDKYKKIFQSMAGTFSFELNPPE